MFWVFEVNTTTRNFAALRPQLNIVRKETGKEIFFCKIHTYDDSHYDGKHFQPLRQIRISDG